MNSIGFNLYFPYEYLKAALVVSLLSVWVLVGLFHYLNRYTKRRYFTIWTAAWLFYALWLTLCISLPGDSQDAFLLMLKQWCVGLSAVFLLWGAARFLKLQTSQRLFGFFMAFLFVWSYIGSFHLEDLLWVQLPIFGLIGLASVLTAWCFFRMRSRREYLGAGLLSFGFLLWGLYLSSYPFLQRSEQLISSGFFISAVLQLFIAVSMIVLVLEEVRNTNQLALRQIQTQKSETALLRSRVVSTEERYRSLFDQASEGIVIAAAEDLRILELNQTAQQLLGINAGDPGQPTLNTFCQVKAQTQPSPTSGQDWFGVVCRQRQINLVRRDGGATPAEVDGAPINFEGQPAFQFFIREMTERARLEQQLRQAEKLSALGRMISGIAHELNNPLAIIKGYLELILSRHELNVQTRADLEKVAHESNRAAKLVGNFLSFAREQPVHRQKTEVNALIHRVTELRQSAIREAGTTVTLDLDSALPPTQADPDQIEQVLVNLVNNALHAVADSSPPGHLRISTRSKGKFILILVEDNGPGIPEEISPHIFEPFFTTKEVGTGTGLGLSIAHSIMADHQGRIFHQPSTEGGACFGLELPIMETLSIDQGPAPDRAGAASVAEIRSFRGAQILVLDDEPSLAELLGEMLTILGHSATVCNSALQALQLVQERPFDLVLSDFRMPVMNGREFYEAVVQNKPHLAKRIIFLTGDVVNEETQAFLTSVGNPHLCKPFQLSTIEKAVAQVLQESVVAAP
ncbi:MAG: response regulator [Chloroflexi bacterium]|nr:response regulator [Chloroflexota bacterium]